MLLAPWVFGTTASVTAQPGVASLLDTMLSFVVNVDPSLPPGAEIMDQATVAANETDPDGSDDTGSVTLVVPDPIFADGFESGDTSQWSASEG